MSIPQTVYKSIREFADNNKKGKIRVYFTDGEFKDYTSAQLNNLSTKEWVELGKNIGLYDNLRVVNLGSDDFIYPSPNPHILSFLDMINEIINQECSGLDMSNEVSMDTKSGILMARRLSRK